MDPELPLAVAPQSQSVSLSDLAIRLASSSDPSARRAALSDLCCAADLGDSTRSVQHGGCIPAITSILGNERDAGVVAKACRAVFLLARNDESKADATSDLVGCLVRVIDGFPDDPVVASSACNALANLAALPGPCQQRVAGTGGAAQAISAVLRRHTGNADVAEAACAALLNLADAPCSHAALAEAGAVPAIVSSLESVLGESPQLAELACGALRNIVAEKESSPLVTGVPSAVPALLTALSRFGAVAQADGGWAPPVIDAVCEALQSIVEAEGARAIDSAAALPVLAQVASAALDRSDVAVLAQALAAIAALANWGRGNGAPDHAGCLPVATRALVQLKGGCGPWPLPQGSTASTLVAPADSLGPAIEASALTCLWFFFRSEGNAKSIDPSLIPAVTAVLVRPGASFLSVLRACSVFRNLGAVGSGAEAAAHECDPVSALASAMAAHIGDADVVQNACHAMYNIIGDTSTHAERLLALELPLRIIEAVALHSKDETCVAAVTKLLSSVVREAPLLLTALLRLGVVAVISEALSVNVREEKIAAHLSNALWWLLQRQPASIGGRGDVAPLSALVATLAAHEGSNAVEFAACGAIAASLENVHGAQFLAHPVCNDALTLTLAIARRRAREPGTKVTERAYCVLTYLMDAECHSCTAASNGIAAHVISAIEAHSDSDCAGLILFGFAVFNRLCVFETSSSALAAAPGLRALLLPTLRKYKGDAGVATQIIALMANLSRTDSGHLAFCEMAGAEGLGVITEVISLHCETPDDVGTDIVEAAVAAVAALTAPIIPDSARGMRLASEMRAAVVASGIIEVLDRVSASRSTNASEEIAELRSHLVAML